MNWKTIETFPKARLTRRLVWRDGKAEFAHWAVMVDDTSALLGGWWWTDRLIGDAEPQPTHWLDILPPEASSENGK